MTEFSTTLEELRVAVTAAFHQFIDYLPWLLAAVLLLVVGWRIARLVRAGTVHLGGALNTALARLGGGARRRSRLTPAVLALIGNVAFWLVVLLSIALAARVAGLDLFTTWLDRIVNYLPTLLAGALILLAGYLVSNVARDLVAATLDSAGSEQSDFFGMLAQGAIFLAALVVGLDQVGVDVTVLTILFGVIVGGLLLSIALAFGLGARSLVSNLIGAQQLRGHLAPGQHARFGEHDGLIVEISPTSVVIATEQGRLHVPASVFQEEAVLVLTAEDDD